MMLALVGDVMLGRLVNETLRRRPPEQPWGDTLPILRAADARVCNLECVLADEGVRARKAFTFRSDEKNVAVLRAAGIGGVSLANNHTLDYGPEALSRMLRTLDAAGIAHAGAGRSATEARAPAMVRAGGLTLAMLSVTDNESDWEAAEERAGVWYVPTDRIDPRAKALVAAVAAAKETADILIVAAHWGSNWGYRPEPGHRELGRALIDAGADIVFGHSCHVVRGIEVYRDRPILYGAGNFIDDYAVSNAEPNDESFVFVLECFQGRMPGIRAHATLIRDFQAVLAQGARRSAIVGRMTTLCGELGTPTRWEESTGTLRVLQPQPPDTSSQGPGPRRIASPNLLTEGDPHMTLELTSPAFQDGGIIPSKFTCDGTDTSPALHWLHVPAGTKSLALICDDPDAPRGTWVHWVLYGLAADQTSLREGVPAHPVVESIGMQGKNDFNRIGYGGPCPPPGNPHRYFFKLYALDSRLELKPGAKKSDVEKAMKGHVLAHGQLVGTYRR